MRFSTTAFIISYARLPCWRIPVGFLKIIFVRMSIGCPKCILYGFSYHCLGCMESYILQSVASMKVTIKEDQYVFPLPINLICKCKEWEAWTEEILRVYLKLKKEKLANDRIKTLNNLVLRSRNLSYKDISEPPSEIHIFGAVIIRNIMESCGAGFIVFASVNIPQKSKCH